MAAREIRMDLPDPIDAIVFRMEQQGLTRKDLEPMIGSRTRVAEVLNRKRNLSIGMIRRLHERLGIPAEILLRPARVHAAAWVWPHRSCVPCHTIERTVLGRSAGFDVAGWPGWQGARA